MPKLYQRLIPYDFVRSVAEAYKSTKDFNELRIMREKGLLSSDELKRLWEVEPTGKDFPLNHTLEGLIGLCLYSASHPLRTLMHSFYTLFIEKRY